MATKHTPLENIIRKQIAKNGPMPVSRYMELCLTHPDYGYYLKQNPLGRDGDFITAPEVSQMFGELVGLWAASVWAAMGSPSEIKFIELGPGRGSMMQDALRAIKILPQLYKAVTVHLVEPSPALRAVQDETLGNAKHVEWYDSLTDVPEGPAIIFANEYFDVLPVHQVVKADDGWHERLIDVDDDIFVYTVAKEPTPRFDVLMPPHVRAAPNGAIYEWRSDTEIMDLTRRVREQGGAALIIDYGHIRSEAGDTFQAVAKHSFTNPLKNPGEADITAHVDFEALAKAAASMGAKAHGPVEQGAFLNKLGIEQRALTLMKSSSHDESVLVAAALKRLTGKGRNGMGQLFKVLGITHPSIETLAALSEPEPVSNLTGTMKR